MSLSFSDETYKVVVNKASEIIIGLIRITYNIPKIKLLLQAFAYPTNSLLNYQVCSMNTNISFTGSYRR